MSAAFKRVVANPTDSGDPTAYYKWHALGSTVTAAVRHRAGSRGSSVSC